MPPGHPQSTDYLAEDTAPLDNASHRTTRTPIISHRPGDFSLEDMQFLAQSFEIVDMHHADSTNTNTIVWIDSRPGTDTYIGHLQQLHDREMYIHRGDYIRGAYELPDGTERIIWEYAVFDDGERTDLTPGAALVEAQASDWKALTAFTN